MFSRQFLALLLIAISPPPSLSQSTCSGQFSRQFVSLLLIAISHPPSLSQSSCSGQFSCLVTDENLLSIQPGVASVEECRRVCSGTQGCRVFTWFSSDSSNEDYRSTCFSFSECPLVDETCTGCFTGQLVCAVGTTQRPEPGPSYPCSDYQDASFYGPSGLPSTRPLIIGHRGSCGMFPEHTALSYSKAAQQGADLIECDLAITKDLKLICGHDPWLSLTTDVADKPEFSHLQRTYNMDDDDPGADWNDKGDITDWFSFDFTLEELRTLRVRQASEDRDPGYDWVETLATLEELDIIVKEEGSRQGRTIGIYPEIKLPHATNKILEERGLGKLEDLVVEALQSLGYDDINSPCYLQSFELSSLEYVKNKTNVPLVLLLKQNITSERWERIDELGLEGLGVSKDGLVTPGWWDDHHRGKYHTTTTFIDTIHKHGLKAHCWTFSNEWTKLHWEDGQDPYSQLKEFLDLGIDGYFSDFPLTTRRFMNYERILCPKTERNS